MVEQDVADVHQGDLGRTERHGDSDRDHQEDEAADGEQDAETRAAADEPGARDGRGAQNELPFSSHHARIFSSASTNRMDGFSSAPCRAM